MFSLTEIAPEWSVDYLVLIERSEHGIKLGDRHARTFFPVPAEVVPAGAVRVSINSRSRRPCSLHRALVVQHGIVVLVNAPTNISSV